jgi:magnesium-transporting ATPase (P-type)
MRALRLSYFAPFMLSLGLLVINLFYEGYRSGEFFHPDHTSKVIIIFSLSLSGLYGIIPWYHINEALSPLKNLSNCNYRDAKNTFETTYDDKLFTVYRDKYTSPKNENYFLLNMAKRESRKENIDF